MQILEKIEGSGRIERGAINTSKTSFRKSRETLLMLQLKTVYPYGFNDCIEDEPEKEATHILVGKCFPPLGRSHPLVTSGNCLQAPSVITPKHFLKLFCKNLDSDLPNVLNFSRIHLIFTNKSKLKNTADFLNGTFNEHCHHDRFSQWF